VLNALGYEYSILITLGDTWVIEYSCYMQLNVVTISTTYLQHVTSNLLNILFIWFSIK